MPLDVRTAQSMEQMGTSQAGYSTFRLYAALAQNTRNVYAIYGKAATPLEVASPLSFPAAFQVAAPFGVNVGGVNPLFFTAAAGAEFDSWLTVGMLNAEDTTAISSIGIDWASWDEATPLSADDGAIFWMDPDRGATRDASMAPIVIAQITVPTGTRFTASVGAQGRSVTGPDWDEPNLMWCQGMAGCASSLPTAVPPPPPPTGLEGTGERCSLQKQGVVNVCVGTDSNGDPMARSQGCVSTEPPIVKIPGAFLTSCACVYSRPACRIFRCSSTW